MQADALIACGDPPARSSQTQIGQRQRSLLPLSQVLNRRTKNAGALAIWLD